MSLYKRGKYYWTSFMFDGRTIQVSTKETSKKKAREFEDNYRSHLHYGKIGLDTKQQKRPRQTFEQAVKGFLESLVGAVKPSTIAAYESKSKMPIKRFGKKLVESIDRGDIDAYVTWRQKTNKKAPARLLIKNDQAKTNKPVSPATINRERTLIAMVLNYAQPGLWQSISQPAGGRKLKQLQEEPEDGKSYHVLSQTEERRYLRACNQPLRDVATIMLDAGLRPHEVLNLKPEHIDFAQGFIVVTKSKTKAGKRKVPMTDRVRKVLEARIKDSVNGWLFPGGRGGKGSLPVVKLTNSHLKALADANKPDADKPTLRLAKIGEPIEEQKASPILPRFRLYDCRHTWATRMARHTDLITLKALGGWSSLRMVEHYSHPTEQHQAEAIRKLELYERAS